MPLIRYFIRSDVPRGKALFTPIAAQVRSHLLHPILREFFLVVVLVPAALCIDLSQASSPNYYSLLAEINAFGIVHIALATVFFSKVNHWMRWMALAFMVLTIIFLIESNLRILLNVRIF